MSRANPHRAAVFPNPAVVSRFQHCRHGHESLGFRSESQFQFQLQRRAFSREAIPGGSGSSGGGTNSSSSSHSFASLAVAAAAAASMITTDKGSDTTHPHLNLHPHLHLQYPSLPTTATTTTFCEEAAVAAAVAAAMNDDIANDQGPEIDPYDNLPEEDEPTHCSICLTYRQGPCRPYWRKVEACTKDHEKENTSKNKQKTKEGGDDKTSGKTETKTTNDNGDESDGGDDNDDGPGTRCFKYMMPWIDCASKFRNLYTLIEMDTNYTEGIADLEATSLHFCWMPGKEPEIDWTKWEQSGGDDNDNETEHKQENETTADNAPVALWKTFDPEMGDPKIITIEARVPAVMVSHDGSEAPGILECAYATDQDNHVIGFAYGTKPSDLLSTNEGNSDGNSDSDSDGDGTIAKGGTPKNDGGDDDRAETIPLNIRLVVSRTTDFVLSASYTHRRVVVAEKNQQNNDGTAAKKSEQGSDPSNVLLESHLYKSKPFSLADVPRVSSVAETETETETDSAIRSKPGERKDQ